MDDEKRHLVRRHDKPDPTPRQHPKGKPLGTGPITLGDLIGIGLILLGALHFMARGLGS